MRRQALIALATALVTATLVHGQPTKPDTPIQWIEIDYMMLGDCAETDAVFPDPTFSADRGWAHTLSWCEEVEPDRTCPNPAGTYRVDCVLCQGHPDDIIDGEVPCPASSLDRWICPGMDEDGTAGIPLARMLDTIPGKRYRVWMRSCNALGCSGASESNRIVCQGDYWHNNDGEVCRRSDGWCP